MPQQGPKSTPWGMLTALRKRKPQEDKTPKSSMRSVQRSAHKIFANVAFNFTYRLLRAILRATPSSHPADAPQPRTAYPNNENDITTPRVRDSALFQVNSGH